jgi:hypothetical protein
MGLSSTTATYCLLVLQVDLTVIYPTDLVDITYSEQRHLSEGDTNRQDELRKDVREREQAEREAVNAFLMTWEAP